MSIDTAEKRFAFIGLLSPSGTMSMPVPGSASLSEQLHLEGRYPFTAVTAQLPRLINRTYLITKRLLGGSWRWVAEHMDDRLWKTVEDVWAVDCGLALPIYLPDTTLTPAAATGSAVSFETDDPVFASYMVGDVIRVGGGVATISTFVSDFEVTCNITTPIADLIPDDPNSIPLPATSGNWSIGVPVTTISGLNHLEGLEVAILADGSVVPNQTVVNGTITLPAAASMVKIGLPFTAQLQTLYNDIQGQATTAQSKRKNIYSVAVRMESTRGIQVGTNQPDASAQPTGFAPDWTNMKEIKDRSSATDAGAPVPLYTGDHFINVPGDWDERGQVAVQQVYPLPANILAVISYIQVGDSPG